MNRAYWQALREELVREGERFGMHIDTTHCEELREQIDILLGPTPHRAVDAIRSDLLQLLDWGFVSQDGSIDIETRLTPDELPKFIALLTEWQAAKHLTPRKS